MLARIGALLTTFALTAVPIASAAPDTFDLQAHRGGRGETTEESLRAFTKAIELGVTTLELDIVLSKDSAPMVWHDPTIQPDKCTEGVHGHLGTRRPSGSSSLTDLLKQPRPDAEDA